MSWTKPADLRAQVQRLWDRGLILRTLAAGESMFPHRLVMKGPTSAELTNRFDEVRQWIAELQQAAHVRIVLRTVQHRVIGANAVPQEIWVDSADDALLLIGKTSEARRFTSLVKLTAERLPAVLPFLERRPLRVLELAEDWPRLLDVVDWVRRHPSSGVYLRQVDIPGVHTKFIEANTGTLSQMLTLLSGEWDESGTEAGVAGFCRRYGFRERPLRIRFRILDPALVLLPGPPDQDVTLDEPTFAALALGVKHVFITENEINFLSFPNAPSSVAIFGAGYGFEHLAAAEWLQRCAVHYWGDIDTHGFAILDQLRVVLPDAQSFLMDRQTLLEHCALWVVEPKPHRRDLSRLAPDERALFDDLRYDRLGSGVRLEQERIGFAWLLARLHEVIGEIRPLDPYPLHT